MTPFVTEEAVCNFLASLRIANGFRPSSFLFIIPGAFPSGFIYGHLHDHIENQTDNTQHRLDSLASGNLIRFLRG